MAAAAELPRLSLADALLVLLVFARARVPQTEAAAVRWAARYVAEVRPAPDAREAHLVLSAASALAEPCPAAGREALHALAIRRRLIELCRALDEWEPPELENELAASAPDRHEVRGRAAWVLHLDPRRRSGLFSGPTVPARLAGRRWSPPSRRR